MEMTENLIEKLKQKKAEIVSKYGSEKLDMSKLDAVDNLDELKDSKQFLKEEDKETKEEKKEDEQTSFKGNDNSFTVEENADGSLVARGSNGTVIKAPNFEQLNRQVLSTMKEASLREGKEPKVTFRSPNKERQAIFAKSAILEHGITIGRGSTLPEDTKFWQELKKDYLKDSKHTEEQWNKMTRFVPDKIMGRTKEESSKNQKLIFDLEAKKKQLGQTKTVQSPKIPHEDKNNLVEEMLRRRQRGS